MNLAEWHSRFSSVFASDRTLRTAAWALVEEELETAYGALRGAILGCRALLKVQDGPVFILSALADLEEALTLLVGYPMERFHVLLNAQSSSFEGRLVDRAHRYHRLLSELLASDTEGLFTDWQGRVLLGAGQYQRLTGNGQEASRILSEAVRWHEMNVGPHGEHDRLCYLGMSLSNLGYVQLQLSGPDEAQRLLDRAILVMPADSRRLSVIYELTALIALERRDLAGAQTAGQTLLELGGMCGYLGSEILAKVALLSKDLARCLEYIEQGTRQAVTVGDWVRVRTLEEIGSHFLHILT